MINIFRGDNAGLDRFFESGQEPRAQRALKNLQGKIMESVKRGVITF